MGILLSSLLYYLVFQCIYCQTISIWRVQDRLWNKTLPAYAYVISRNPAKANRHAMGWYSQRFYKIHRDNPQNQTFVCDCNAKLSKTQIWATYEAVLWQKIDAWSRHTMAGDAVCYYRLLSSLSAVGRSAPLRSWNPVVHSVSGIFFLLSGTHFWQKNINLSQMFLVRHRMTKCSVDLCHLAIVRWLALYLGNKCCQTWNECAHVPLPGWRVHVICASSYFPSSTAHHSIHMDSLYVYVFLIFRYMLTYLLNLCYPCLSTIWQTE